MPADHASGRFSLLMNGWSRKAFPLGTTAALSLLISTAAHADQCFGNVTGGGATVIAQAAWPTAAKACILEDGNMRATASTCRQSVVKLEQSPGATDLPAQQPTAR